MCLRACSNERFDGESGQWERVRCSLSLFGTCTEINCELKLNEARGKHVVFARSSAATVKFAHSHAFFVSLTFHVEAKAWPGAIFLPASLTQWGHTIQNPENVKNGKFKGFFEQLCTLSDEGRLLECRGQNGIHLYKGRDDMLLHRIASPFIFDPPTADAQI